MDRQIDYYLRYVANRFRRVRYAWILTAIWLFLALFILMAVNDPETRGRISWFWLSAIGVAALIWGLNRFSFRNRDWIAHRVEGVHPDLRQQLITSLQPETPHTSSFLRTELMEKTIQHARSNDWGLAVPSKAMATAWIVQFLSLAFACFASWSVVTGNPVSKQSAVEPPSQQKREQSIVVEPGNIEVERGSDVVVSARFQGDVPETTWLSQKVLNGDTTSDKSPMNRSMSDPVFGGYLRNVAADTKYRIESELGSSEEFTIQVFDYPSLVRSDASITPPEYAKQEPRTIEDTRRVSVAEGASLKWTCFVNKPLQTAELVDEKGETVPLVTSADDPLRLEAAFVIDESKQWSVRLTDDRNRSAKFDDKLIAKVIRNNAPEIKLARAQDMRVSPLQEVPLQATVRDDFEVKRSGITVTVGSNEASESELTPNPSKAGKLELSHLVDLEKLGAEPDQLVSYFFWAEDIDREGQVRRVEGDMFFAEIRPFEEIFREGESPSASQQRQQQQQQSQAGQQSEELAEQQKQIISATWNILRRETGKNRTPNFKKDVEVLRESQSDLLEKTAQLEESIRDEKSASYLKELQSSMGQAIEALESASNESSLESLRDALSQERKAYESLLKLRAREFNIVRQQQQRNQRNNSRSSAQQNRQEQLEQLKLDEQENKYEEEQKAEEQETTPQREARQVMSRLEELARRQKDLNEQLKNIENAIREAKTEEQKKELEEQLQRLREDQEEMVRDTDELLERMNQEENRQTMQQAREQVEQAREQLQQSAKALAQNQTSPALSSGTRAERQMDETREQMREESSSQMEQTMRDLVQQAKELERKQKELTENLKPKEDGSSRRNSADEENASALRPEGTEENAPSQQQAWRNQKQKLNQLLDAVQDTVTQAESSEPLLAEQLYDSFREAKQDGVDKRLDQIPLLLNRGLEDMADRMANEASEGIRKLREGVEKASENVLGNEQESLRRALKEIDNARNQLEQEIRDRDPSTSSANERSSSDPNARQSQEPSDRPAGSNQDPSLPPNSETNRESTRGQQARDDARGESDPNRGQPSQQPNQDPNANPTQPRDASSPNPDQDPNQPNSEQPGQNRNSEEQPNRQQQTQGTRPNRSGSPGQRTPDSDRTQRENEGIRSLQDEVAGPGTPRINREARLGERRAAPLTGEDYRNWTDALRDVEELVTDQELKGDVARIRESAREMRAEFKRHSKEPQWDLVRRLIAEPLGRLREQVNEELLRKAAEKNSLVPIDRDPVPSTYQRQLDRYYENIGSGVAR
ncbi:MAG: hypothetical protein KGQ60_00195 [Planctomycetes bacterium]|nr:hypothetical protein [Planctomycetota bacterium]